MTVKFPGYRFFLAVLYCSLCVALILSGSFKASAQNNEVPSAQQRQKAIYIFNIAQNVTWPRYAVKQSFRMGVLGDKVLFDELVLLSRSRAVLGKKVEVIGFNSINQVEDVQLLFVNKNLNFDIKEVLKKVKGKYTLVVGQDYGFKESMINIRQVNRSILFELNEQLIREEGLKVSTSLTESAITSADRWLALYEESEESLERQKLIVENQFLRMKEQEAKLDSQQLTLTNQQKLLNTQKLDLQYQQGLLNQQSSELKQQEQRIGSQKSEIVGFNSELEKLSGLNDEKQRLLTEKNAVLLEKQRDILQRQQIIEKNQKELTQQRDELADQQKEIQAQESRINRQKDVLGKQTLALAAAKKVSYLLVILFMLSVFLLLSFYRNDRLKRKVNLELMEKNEAINRQAKLLESKNQELEQFAYIASHDLQEPLRTVTNFVDVLEEDYEEQLDEDGMHYLKLIAQSTERMRRLIKGLLDYSRIGARREFKMVNCDQLLTDVLEDLSSTIERNQAKVEVGNLPPIKGSEVELRSLFQNLINNGIKFTKPGVPPVLKVWAEPMGEFWKFAVQDNGIGIKPEYHSKIFAIFQRLHNSEEYEGTGIGLAHCKKIVDIHSGTIWLESEENKGTTFFFTMPNLEE